MVKIRRLVKQTFQTFLKFENINTSIELDNELQNEKLETFLLDVRSSQSKQNNHCLHLKTNISASTF